MTIQNFFDMLMDYDPSLSENNMIQYCNTAMFDLCAASNLHKELSSALTPSGSDPPVYAIPDTIVRIFYVTVVQPTSGDTTRISEQMGSGLVRNGSDAATDGQMAWELEGSTLTVIDTVSGAPVTVSGDLKVFGVVVKSISTSDVAAGSMPMEPQWDDAITWHVLSRVYRRPGMKDLKESRFWRNEYLTELRRAKMIGKGNKKTWTAVQAS